MISRTLDNASASLSFNPTLVKKRGFSSGCLSRPVLKPESILFINKQKYLFHAGTQGDPRHLRPGRPCGALRQPWGCPKCRQPPVPPGEGSAGTAPPLPGHSPSAHAPSRPPPFGSFHSSQRGVNSLKIHVYLPQNHLYIKTNASLYR